ncbi:hypothetical protein AAFF_G00324870 [Aldrovandia affinis]|uniref:Centrobin n=1 Tax=Aldrovandia affinis TaxID=143900 RepID=A0AAD7X247_9TELE|nr:hypothetical protein AAFF_G00324870 [Aldrovandia affinis]
MSSLKNEDLLSDVEPLPGSAPPSPSHSPLTQSLTNWPHPFSSHCPTSLANSWPPSPLPALATSSQVTARLYTSLQRSRELEVLTAAGSLPEHIDRPRQVTFNLSSPNRCSEKETLLHPQTRVGWPEASSFSKQLGEREGSTSNSPVSLSARLSPRVDDPTSHTLKDGEEAGEDLELGKLVEEMSLNLQARADNPSATVPNGRRHIQDMENVRSHLQTMLRSTQEPLEPDGGATILNRCTLPERHRQDNESFESDSTAHLLSAPMLADASPPLSLSGLEELFPRYTRMRPESGPFSSETQVLRDSLERERVRRKQHEKQIQALQNKALQLQQQLALAVSADRKKDIMIEQLDKTLAKVVEGWRRHEEEKSAGVRRLQEEKEAAEEVQAKQQEVLMRFEQSLAQAAETLDREQKHTEELHSTNQQLEQQLSERSEQLQELRQKWEQAQDESERLQAQAQEARASLAQHREAWAGTEQALQERLTLQGAELDSEKGSRKRDAQQLQDSQRELQGVQGRLQQLEGELEEARRERDRVHMDRALDQARFEAQCSQLEVQFKLSVEQQVTERLAVLQEDNAKTTASLREQHRKQLLDLRAHHERDLSAQQAQFRTELEGRDERLRKLTEEYEKKASVKQEEVLCLEASRRKLEAQRTELVTRLQGLMRSHWAEALRLLTIQGQTDDATSPSSLFEKGVSQPASGWDRDRRAWELQTKRNGGLTESGSESGHTSDVPQVVALQLSRERGGAKGDPSARDGSPCAPEQDIGVLLDHSHTFSALEPLLDDTAGTEGAGDRGFSVDTGRQQSGHGRERGYSSDREGLERGYSSEKEENAGYRACRAGAGQSGRNAALTQDRAARERGFPAGHEEYRPVARLNMSGTESIKDSSYSSTVVNQAKTGFSRGLEGCGAGNSFGLGRPGSARGDPGATRRPLGPTTQAESPGTQEDRQSELQYYISMLLDRPPGEPLESSALDIGQDLAGQSYTGAKMGVGASWDREQTKAPAGKVVSPQHPLSAAVTKTKLHPAYPTQNPPGRPDPRPLPAQAGSALSPQMLSQLSHLLSQYHSQPDRATLSLEELLASMLCSQADRKGAHLDITSSPRGGPTQSWSFQGAGDRQGDIHRNPDQKLSQEGKKEAALSAPQRRGQPPRPAGCERTQSQAPRGRKAGPQTQRGGVWR